MPRYFFHVTNGQEDLNPHKGMDLAGNAAAREEAVVLARDLADGKMFPERKWAGWFVKIVDQHGHEVDTVPIGVVE